MPTFQMKKIAPIFIVLAVLILGGLAVIGVNKQILPSSQSPKPTEKQSLVSSPTPKIGEKEEGKILLTITSPVSGSGTVTPHVTVKGQTVPNAEVFVNDVSGKADMNGYFAVPVTIDEGENTISVIVNDADGNAAEKEIIVSYNPGT